MDFKLLTYIIVSIVLLIAYGTIGKKIQNKLSKKAPNWGNFYKLIYRLSFFLFLLLLIGINLERFGIKISDYLTVNFLNSEKYRITPYTILLTMVIFAVTRGITIGMRSLFLSKIEHKELIDYGNFNIHKLINHVIWIIFALIVLNLSGIDLTLLFAGSAALLVGVGIAMQQIFNDSISGFFLLFERNLKINDVVEIDEVIGKVQDIGIRTSRIITRDNIEMIVPNSKLVSATVINWSSNDHKTRFYLDVGVAYESNVQLVKKLLIEAAESHSLILKSPAPTVFFENFGDSSLNFKLGFWTKKTFEHQIILSDLRFVIEKKFRENNITIPFPQHDVHIKNA